MLIETDSARRISARRPSDSLSSSIILRGIRSWRTRSFGLLVVSVSVLAGGVSPSVSAQVKVNQITPEQVDRVVTSLEAAAKNYVFPDIALQLQKSIEGDRAQYRSISDPRALADRLTADMRAVGHDQHLLVTFGEELAVQKDPTPDEKAHAHEFDRSSGYGVRSSRRLPGNVGYIDLAYFSPDSNAGAAIAAAMRVASGTDALIIDLRKNGGGSGDTMTTFASYFYDDVTQMFSVIELIGGHTHERQHWTSGYVEGPRYLDRSVFILTSLRTHSAAEVFVYDLKNSHRATVVGERTSGDATSGTGEISVGYGFSAFIANGQTLSPITHTNYIRVGVQPDVEIVPADALLAAYTLALKTGKLNIESDELSKEKTDALNDPKAALLQEIDGFPKSR
jgi:retinol-binding protein 3